MKWLVCIVVLIVRNNDDSAQISDENVALSEMYVSAKKPAD